MKSLLHFDTAVRCIEDLGLVLEESPFFSGIIVKDPAPEREVFGPFVVIVSIEYTDLYDLTVAQLVAKIMDHAEALGLHEYSG